MHNKPMNTTRKKPETKAEVVYDGVLHLLDAGADLQSVTVQQIADAAGIGKGTVYEYFASKEEILRGMAAYCTANETDALRAALAPCNTLDATLDALAGYLHDVMATRMAAYRILTQTLAAHCPAEGGCKPPLDEENPLVVLFGETVVRLQAAGEIAPQLSVRYCVFAIVAACMSCVMGGMVTSADGLPEARLLMKRALQP